MHNHLLLSIAIAATVVKVLMVAICAERPDSLGCARRRTPFVKEAALAATRASTTTGVERTMRGLAKVPVGSYLYATPALAGSATLYRMSLTRL